MGRMGMLAGLRGKPLDDEDDLEQGEEPEAEHDEDEADDEAPDSGPAAELAAAREALGEAWLAGGCTLAEAIRRKVTALETAAAPPTKHAHERCLALEHLEARLARAKRPREREAIRVMLELLGGA